MYNFLNFLFYVVMVIFLLIGVSFFTLLERKVLSYIQLRKGPEKASFMGLLQPISDVLKLYFKGWLYPYKSSFFFFFFCPILMLLISMLVWVIMPYNLGFHNFELGLLFFLSCLSAGVWSVIGSGWSSNSKYPLIGFIRGVAQTISYEVVLFIIFINLVLLVESMNMKFIILIQESSWLIWSLSIISVMWFICMLAELNRSPFDFVEGESELVSGFNTEYGGSGFALFFMAEYLSMIFTSFCFVFIFFYSNFMDIFFYVKVSMLSFMIVWVRGSFPRLRYDKLMYMCWKSILPMILFLVIYILMIKVFLEFLLI
uniref:NADH dehydrogenase subunit 1 n=1 Tax=Lophogaster typicus TaxID=419538 RepID=UPI002176CD0E|nr:NADH dehydrogenase subunit 1 [Lophogaster typicus]UUL70717.1 NADH dehydrogenase subunit 1 [Lophogaster typicus]